MRGGCLAHIQRGVLHQTTTTIRGCLAWGLSWRSLLFRVWARGKVRHSFWEHYWPQRNSLHFSIHHSPTTTIICWRGDHWQPVACQPLWCKQSLRKVLAEACEILKVLKQLEVPKKINLLQCATFFCLEANHSLIVGRLLLFPSYCLLLI